MCGLVGIMSSNMMNKHEECLKSMLYLDTWRGKDSTGVAALRHNADTAILKSTVPGYEFIEGPRLSQHLRLNDFLWIGHNRFGTIGKNIKTNAHPFSIEDEDGVSLVVGAHNGTLKNKHDLKDHQHFGTDSEALYYNIALDGIENVIPKVEGAWALTYYDHTAEEFRILRNKERTLFYAFEKGKKTFIWASEMWMIRVAAARANIELDEDKVFAFNEDTLYSIPAPIKMNEVLEITRKGGLVGKTPAFFQGGLWQNGKFMGAQTQQKREETPPARRHPPLSLPPSQCTIQQHASGGSQTPEKTSSSEKQSESKVVDINSGKTYRGYGGAELTKAELEEQLDGGCVWCENEKITIDDKGYGFLGVARPVCAKCLEGEHEDQDVINAVFEEIPAKSKMN